jgi:hypothetical protein
MPPPPGLRQNTIKGMGRLVYPMLQIGARSSKFAYRQPVTRNPKMRDGREDRP